MSRVICPTCQRPEKVCLCHWIQAIDNTVEVAILQHPSEVSQIKGTARIVELSLQNSKLWVGEDFSDEASLHQWLAEGEVLLLYPEVEALKQGESSPLMLNIEQARQRFALSQIKILVLDGTWRKTHKMMMLNPFLQALPRLQLTPQRPSAYQIRKQKDQGSLSTVEAVFEVLSQLEQNPQKYQPLIDAFEQMVAQQLAFRNSAASTKP